MSIVQLFNSLSDNVKIFFQWVPSHVYACGNEIADGLAREGSHKNSTHGHCFTFSEIATRVKQDISSSWQQASVHEWYEGPALLGAGSRRDQTTLARLRSGHTGVQRHVVVLKFTLFVRIAM
ncbi:RNase H domain-containing protein [Trichonephila clavipes]|nr:RNase H domain-containing protein [Trichonephila clavipes]